MSENQTAAENVSRGTTFTIAIIPIAIVIFAVVGSVNMIALFIVSAGIIPTLARGLYVRGAGAPLSRAAWKPFIALTSVALLLGVFTGLVFRTFAGFSTVNPRLGLGGILTPAFWTTFGRNFDGSNSGLLIQAAFALGVGVLTLVGVLRGQLIGKPKGTPEQQPFSAPESIPPMTPDAASFTPAQGAPTAAPPAAPPVAPPAYDAQPFPPAAPVTQPAAPAAAIINPTSSGVLLNGKPIDDAGKKKK